MLLGTGTRFSKLAKLRWDHVDLQNCSIKLWRLKVNIETTLFTTDRLHIVLTKRFTRMSKEFAFTNSKVNAMDYRHKIFEHIFNRANLLGVTAHTLRHTHAFGLVQAGMKLCEIKEVLGHADINTTMRYAQLDRSTITQRVTDAINSLNGQASRAGIHTTCGTGIA